MKIIAFNVCARYFVWNFKGYLWNSTQNILPIHWKMWILFTGKKLRTLRFKSSSVSVFETPPVSIKRCRLTSTGNPIVEIRLFQERRFYLHDGISYRVGKSVSLHQDIEAGDAYMRQWTRSSLVVACLLCGTSALDKIPRDIGSALHYLVMP